MAGWVAIVVVRVEAGDVGQPIADPGVVAVGLLGDEFHELREDGLVDVRLPLLHGLFVEAVGAGIERGGNRAGGKLEVEEVQDVAAHGLDHRVPRGGGGLVCRTGRRGRRRRRSCPSPTGSVRIPAYHDEWTPNTPRRLVAHGGVESGEVVEDDAAITGIVGGFMVDSVGEIPRPFNTIPNPAGSSALRRRAWLCCEGRPLALH